MSRLVKSPHQPVRFNPAAPKKERKTRSDKGSTRPTPLPLALDSISLERLLRESRRMFSALTRGRS